MECCLVILNIEHYLPVERIKQVGERGGEGRRRGGKESGDIGISS